MWTLLTDPLGRELLTVLTTDHGLPGDPQRLVLLRALQDLRAVAERRRAPVPVRRAIRSALWALRAEFPAAMPLGHADPRDASVDDGDASTSTCRNYNHAGLPRL